VRVDTLPSLDASFAVDVVAALASENQ